LLRNAGHRVRETVVWPIGVPDSSATIVTYSESRPSHIRQRSTLPRGSIRSTVPGANNPENASSQQRW
jgi:hypothetical protein